MVLSSSPRHSLESEKRSFSVASLVQSVKNGYRKAMDHIKDRGPSINKKTVMLTGLLATTVPAMANTPPPGVPLEPIASSERVLQQADAVAEAERALDEIFIPSARKPSWTVSDAYGTCMVTPNTVSLDVGPLEKTTILS